MKSTILNAIIGVIKAAFVSPIAKLLIYAIMTERGTFCIVVESVSSTI